MPILAINPSGTYLILSDRQGTPRAVKSFSTSQTVWTWNPNPFGTIDPSNPIPTAPFTLNLRFPGQYLDAETGNFYNDHRTYSPQLGRYLESDPIGLLSGPNSYIYVDSNPVTGVDPLGLFNATKGVSALGNVIISAGSGASGALKIAIAAGLQPASVTGVGALPPLALATWGTWNLKSSMAAWQRAQQQWNEALCEDSSKATWRNLNGMLPGGTNYDDPGEYTGPIDYIEHQGWWNFIQHLGYF